MTHGNNTPDVRALLFRLLNTPECDRDALLRRERERQAEVAAAAERAFAEVKALLERLPEDSQAGRAALRAGPTLDPWILEAVEHVLDLPEPPPEIPPLPPIQPSERLPVYSAELAEGSLFGYYLIEERLSKGGMGVVYLARDTRFPEEPRVALKLLLSIDATRLDWFRDEAAILYSLAQEGSVVGIRDFGTDPAPFIAMEYVEGGSLGDALHGQVWPPPGQQRARAAAALVRTLARTLQATHSAGIFHLDLKPANVLLHEQRGPLLADFSLARRIRGGNDPVLLPLGTPAYLAPEQAARLPNANPTLIDVYGLGAILYECLTGRPPIAPGQGESVSRLLKRIQTEQPTPPSALAEVPPDLEKICLCCLARKPDERYSSADRVRHDLDSFLRGDEPQVGCWPRHRRARHYVRRHWVGIGVGTVVASLLVACFISAILVLVFRADAAEEKALREQEDRSHAEELVQTNRQHHRQQIHAAAQSAAEKGDWKLALELYETALRDYPAADPERLPLEVERLPGWFLYRSRQEVAAELDRLDRVRNLAARERARVQLYQADLRLSENGQAPANLELLRKALASGTLDRADTLYAQSLLAPTSRESLAKLRELVASHPGHYRGRASFLGLLFVRGELDEVRDRLRLHRDRFPGDPTAAMLGALLDIVQGDDLAGALTRIDAARDRLGEERWRRGRTFLKEWSRLLRAAAQDDVPNPGNLLQLKVIVGGDTDVFSLNLPTTHWLEDHWGAAASAFLASMWGSVVGPEAAVKKWRAVCTDSPEAIFLFNQAVSELALARQAEKQGRKEESLQRCSRAADLSYQAGDARAPTLLPRSEWRYKALTMAVLADAAFLASCGREAWREKRLLEGARRAVSEGRSHRDFRARNLPQLVAQLSDLARMSGHPLLARVAHTLLSEWMQEEADNPVPYRLRAKLALDLKEPVIAWAVVDLWYRDKRHAKDAQLEELGKKAKDGVGRLFSAPAR